MRWRSGRSRSPCARTRRRSSSRAKQRLRRQDSYACGGELDREREPVEPATDVRDRTRVALGEREASLASRARSANPATDAVSQQRVDVCRPVRGRELERRDGHHALGRYAERRAARHERSECRGTPRAIARRAAAASTTCSKLSRTSSSRRETRYPASASAAGSAARLLEPERPGDRRGDEERVADRRQVDEEDPVREVRDEIARDRPREASLPGPAGA